MEKLKALLVAIEEMKRIILEVRENETLPYEVRTKKIHHMQVVLSQSRQIALEMAEALLEQLYKHRKAG